MEIRGVAKNGGTRGGISWWHPSSAKIYVKPKTKRSSLQNKLVFSPKVCDDQKKKSLSEFSVSKAKNKQMVSPQNSDMPLPFP